MCRNITTLRGLEPAATPEEIEAAARQYVRKVSGVQSTSAATGAPDPEVWEFGRRTSYTLTNVYAMRMAAVFIISTTTIGIRLQIMPRWLGVLGFGSAALLLVGSSTIPWLTLAFPLWVLVLSLHILVTDLRAGAGEDGLSRRRAGS